MRRSDEDDVLCFQKKKGGAAAWLLGPRASEGHRWSVPIEGGGRRGEGPGAQSEKQKKRKDK